jgi:hypothetical protein
MGRKTSRRECASVPFRAEGYALPHVCQFLPRNPGKRFLGQNPLRFVPRFRQPLYRTSTPTAPHGAKPLEFCLLRTFIVPSVASVLSTPRSTTLDKSRPNGKSVRTKLHPVLSHPKPVELDKTRREGHHQIFKDRCINVHVRLSKIRPRKRALFSAGQGKSLSRMPAF